MCLSVITYSEAQPFLWGSEAAGNKQVFVGRNCTSKAKVRDQVASGWWQQADVRWPLCPETFWFGCRWRMKSLSDRCGLLKSTFVPEFKMTDLAWFKISFTVILISTVILLVKFKFICCLYLFYASVPISFFWHFFDLNGCSWNTCYFPRGSISILILISLKQTKTATFCAPTCVGRGFHLGKVVCIST